MFLQSRDPLSPRLEDEFSKPVESIMRCEDFKSNFARRLSNRYTSKTSKSPPRPDTALKLRPPDDIEGANASASNNAPERIELGSQLSENFNMEQNGEAVKPPDKASKNDTDIQQTVLNMEVETLRWQLAQTEANRQMHIALLKQIVAFLNRVKDHIESKESSLRKDSLPTRLLPRSFNVADLPRSRSTVHVNKNLEYSLTSPKKMSTRKISKSITSVNGFKDCNGAWNHSKLSLTPQTENSHKISEEMTRLITLANTVLSTKIPDLACSCIDKNGDSNLEIGSDKITIGNVKSTAKGSNATPNEMEKDVSNIEDLFTTETKIITKPIINESFLIHSKNETLNTFKETSSFYCMENNFSIAKLPHENNMTIKERPEIIPTKSSIEIKNDFNSSFIEDESGFSSMSSFQEIGIPIISIIPPSPCKEMGFLEEIPDLLEDAKKWKNDHMELDKQTVKVFWV